MKETLIVSCNPRAIPPPAPLYLLSASESRDGLLPMILFSVAVAGFNKENRVCELRLCRLLFGKKRKKSPRRIAKRSTI